MNAILLFMTPYSESKAEGLYTYRMEDGTEGTVSGAQTNDAPVKYLLKLGQKEERPVDKIFCITSDTAEKRDEGLNKFKNTIKKFTEKEEGMTMPKIISIRYGEQEDRKKASTDILLALSDMLSAEDHVYIDYTGGMRDISLLMVVLTRFLAFKGVSCDRVIYSRQKGRIPERDSFFLRLKTAFQKPEALRTGHTQNAEAKKTEAGLFVNGEIHDLDYIYRLFDLINAMEAFKNTGDVRLMEVYFGRRRLKDFPEFKAAFDAMKQFSEQISISNASLVGSAFWRLHRALDKENFKGEYGLEEQVFLCMLDEIRAKYSLPEMGAPTELQPDFYLNLTEWCVRNGYLQQALTIYTEMVPRMYYSLGWLPRNRSFRLNDGSALQRGELSLADSLYYEIFSRIDGHREEHRDRSFNDVLRVEILRGLSELNLPESFRVEKEDLRSILNYYLYIKRIRNQISHAVLSDPRRTQKKTNPAAEQSRAEPRQQTAQAAPAEHPVYQYLREHHLLLNKDNIGAQYVRDSLVRAVRMNRELLEKYGNQKEILEPEQPSL